MGLYVSKEDSDENKLLKRMLRENILSQREQREQREQKTALSSEDIQKIMINVADSITSKIATTIDEKLKNSQQVVYNTTVSQSNSSQQTEKYDDFDTTGTMQKLAKSMLEPSKNTQSSLNNIGDVHETKKNTKDMDDAIDFLSNVGD